MRIGTAIIFAGKKLAFGNPVKVQLVRGSEIRNEMAFAVVTEEVHQRGIRREKKKLEKRIIE